MNLLAIIPATLAGLIHSFGWTPVGQSMELLIEEADDPALVGSRMLGVIVSVNLDGSASFNSNTGTRINLVPRHEGYGFHYLPIGSIAVYLAKKSPDKQRFDGDQRFATGILALSRQ